jgi:hypothetical protein
VNLNKNVNKIQLGQIPVFILSVLVILHELKGHYVAQKCSSRVEVLPFMDAGFHLLKENWRYRMGVVGCRWVAM